MMNGAATGGRLGGGPGDRMRRKGTSTAGTIFSYGHCSLFRLLAGRDGASEESWTPRTRRWEAYVQVTWSLSRCSFDASVVVTGRWCERKPWDGILCPEGDPLPSFKKRKKQKEGKKRRNARVKIRHAGRAGGEAKLGRLGPRVRGNQGRGGKGSEGFSGLRGFRFNDSDR